MKTLFTLLFSICSVVLLAQWTQTSGPEGGMVNCITRVGNEIWLGSHSGIYVSHNEGMSWSRNSVVTTYCTGIFAEGDTVVVVYALPVALSNIGTGSNLYSIASYDGGNTWGDTVILAQGYFSYPPMFYSTPIQKIQNSLLITVDGRYEKSNDWAQSWMVWPFINNTGVTLLCVDDSAALAKTYIPSSNGYGYFYSANVGDSWMLIDSIHNLGGMFLNEGILNAISYRYDTSVHSSIIRSTNLGQTWDTVYNAPSGEMLYDFIKLHDTIFITANSFSLATTNNGQSWQNSPFIDFANYLSYETDLTNGGKLGYKSPGGLGIYVPQQSVFYNTTTGFISSLTNGLVANGNTIFTSTDESFYRTIDDGYTWIDCGLPVGPPEDLVIKGDTLVGLLENYIVRSYNNGVTWDTLSTPFVAHAIERIGNRIYTATGQHYYSDNWGQTWQQYPDLDTSVLNICGAGVDETGAIKAAGGFLFLVTEGGVIARYNPGTNLWSHSACFWSTGANVGNALYAVGNDIVMSGRDELMISHDMGLTWQYDSLRGLPMDTSQFGNITPLSIPKNIILVNGLWLGTCGPYGIYASTTGGNNWVRYTAADLQFIPRGLTVRNNIIYTGSYYCGVWKRTTSPANITGTVYRDLNNNGMRDNGEPPIVNRMVRTIPGSWMATTDTGGHYSMLADATGDTLKPVLATTWESNKPDHYITSNNATNLDFGIYLQPGIADLAIDITNSSVFRPGFETSIALTARNKGSLIQAGIIQLTLDSSLLFLSSTTAPVSVNGNVYIWNTSSLDFEESQSITIRVQTSVTAAIGDSVLCAVDISPLINDTVPADNSATLATVIVGSYDPNDKTCEQGQFITPEQLQSGEQLVYTIRFQNTGNYPADFVRVTDTLSQFFDLSTFKVIAQSHDMHWAISGQGVVNFYFDSIMLPASSYDEPASHGFVKYSISCKPDMQKGNALTNTANIYFDFNTAIVTNTTTTLVAYPFTSVNAGSRPTDNSLIRVYPNPTNNFLFLDLDKQPKPGTAIQVYDLTGKCTRNDFVVSARHAINVSDMPAGLYLGRLINVEVGVIGYFKFIVYH
jgi:hypothetical protein